jgi:hypothetical protein
VRQWKKLGRTRAVSGSRPTEAMKSMPAQSRMVKTCVQEVGKLKGDGSVLSRGLGRSLGRGIDGGSRVGDRGVAGRRRGAVLTAVLHALEARKHATAFLDLGSTGRHANRDRGRTRRRYNDRTGGGCTATLLFVASFSIASQDKRTYESTQEQSHEVPFHGCISLDDFADRSGYTVR